MKDAFEEALSVPLARSATLESFCGSVDLLGPIGDLIHGIWSRLDQAGDDLDY